MSRKQFLPFAIEQGQPLTRSKSERLLLERKTSDGKLIRCSSVYDTYWRFAAERQAIFFRRIERAPEPWTADPVLNRHKFTNVYRAADRVSQYLIRNVIYRGDLSVENVFLRSMVFKVFNSIKTWETLVREFGEISVDTFDCRKFGDVLTKARRAGPIFSGAYIMPSAGRKSVSQNKHDAWLALIDRQLLDGVPERLANVRTMKEAFLLLRSYPMIGDFLAYQFAIDLNYGPIINFSEDDFVMAGPGARSGIEKCFPGRTDLDAADVIRMMVDLQEQEFERLGLRFRNLWGRRLHLIDCQNLFCEVDKYARVAHPEVAGVGDRTRIKQKFKPNVKQIDYWFPPKWGVHPT